MFFTVIYIAEIRFVGKLVIDHTDTFIYQRTECYLNNTITLRPLTPHIMPQNGDRIVAIDSATSLHPLYTFSIHRVGVCMRLDMTRSASAALDVGEPIN